MKGFFKEKNAAISFFCYCAVTLTLLLGGFYGILNDMFFEEKIYMFASGSEGALTVYYTLCALTVAAAVIFCAICKRRKTDLTTVFSVGMGETENIVAGGIRLAGGAIFAVGAVMRLIFHFGEKSSSTLPSAVTALMLLFYVCLTLYFFPEVGKKLSIPSLSPVCGMLGAVAFIIDTLATYADMSIPISSEYRILTAVCSVLFLLALVSELRIKLAEPKPHSYLALFAIASAVGGSISLGRMISICGGKSVSGTELARTVCGIGITLYTVSRLLTVTFSRSHGDEAEIPESNAPENDGNEITKEAE